MQVVDPESSRFCDDETITLNSWLEDMELAQELEHWDMSTAVDRATFYLGDRVTREVRLMLRERPHLRSSWSEFKAALFERYRSPAKIYPLLFQLFALRQTSTVADYTRRFNDLAIRIQDVENNDMYDALLAHYMYGLKKEIRARVVDSDPKDLATAQAEASIYS